MMPALPDALRTPRGILTALFVTAWLGVVFLAPRPVHDPATNSTEAAAQLALAMKEFCGELYSEGNCPRVSAGGKSRRFHTAIFSPDAAPSVDSVAVVLAAQGWVRASPAGARVATFCRRRYAAEYSLDENHVWVEFSAGNSTCW